MPLDPFEAAFLSPPEELGVLGELLELAALAVLDVLDVDELDELEELEETGSTCVGRESVEYQPDPLKMIPAGYRSRRMSPPQVGQTFSGSSLKCCRRSTRA